MPDFEVEIRGKLGYWPDDWNVGNELKLDRCIFERENKEQIFRSKLL